MVTAQRFASVDPAFYNVASNPQFIGLAYDTLLTFEHSGGADGVRLVPDLALSIPSPTHGGRTYTFRLRPWIRYADGRLVRAGDFRRAIERLFRLKSPGSSFFTGIVGAAACTAHPGRCDLSSGVLTDDRTGMVSFKLAAPDADFLYELTEQAYSAPVPPPLSTTQKAQPEPPVPVRTGSPLSTPARSGCCEIPGFASGHMPPSRRATPTRSSGDSWRRHERRSTRSTTGRRTGSSGSSRHRNTAGSSFMRRAAFIPARSSESTSCP